MVTEKSICIASEDVVFRKIEDDMIVVPLTVGIGEQEDELYTINDTGQEILAALDGQRDLAEVAELLYQEFDSTKEQILDEVLGFTQELVKRNILKVK